MYERERSLRRRILTSVKVGAAGIVAAGVAGAIAGGYFYPRGERIEVPVIATPTPSAAAGTPPEATPGVGDQIYEEYLKNYYAAQPGPTATPMPEAIPTIPSQASREERLLNLDQVYRNEGVEAWLRKAGYTWDTLRAQARNPEEETINNRILVSGIQVNVRNLNAPYPAGLTTDQPVGLCIKPDLNNPSHLCTEVKGFTGSATLWTDLSNWGPLTPNQIAK